MKISNSLTDRHSPDSQKGTAPISIVQYNSSAGIVKAKIQLKQNLFSFLLEGKKSIQYAGTKSSIGPHQFFLLTAGNCLMSEKIAINSGQYRSMLFFFDDSLLADFFTRHPPMHQGSIKNYNKEPFIVFEKDAFLVNFIESLGFILASEQHLSAELRKVKLEELLVYLSERYPEIILRLRHSSFRVDNDLLIREAVTANMDSAVTVEELAFLCHMSLSTFKRRFAQIYDTSPNKWLLEKRMQKAAHLLLQGKHKASEIYLELGYESLSGFIQSFKHFHGRTPKQYQLLN